MADLNDPLVKRIQLSGMSALQDHELEELAATKPALFDDAWKILAERAYLNQFEFDYKNGAQTAQECADFNMEMFENDMDA